MDFKKININKVEEKIYEMKLSKLDGNGKLKIEFLQGTIIDEGNLESKAKSIDLGITIDNIAPIGNFAETRNFWGQSKWKNKA